MDELFDLWLDFVAMLALITFLVILMVLFANFALLKNISTRIMKEAEIQGVITSDYINKTYANSPLSKLNGQFHVEEITPGINQKAKHLGDKIYIKVSKEIYLTSKFHVKITASAHAINQGYYGEGYRT